MEGKRKNGIDKWEDGRGDCGDRHQTENRKWMRKKEAMRSSVGNLEDSHWNSRILKTLRSSFDIDQVIRDVPRFLNFCKNLQDLLSDFRSLGKEIKNEREGAIFRFF